MSGEAGYRRLRANAKDEKGQQCLFSLNILSHILFFSENEVYVAYVLELSSKFSAYYYYVSISK